GRGRSRQAEAPDEVSREGAAWPQRDRDARHEGRRPQASSARRGLPRRDPLARRGGAPGSLRRLTLARRRTPRTRHFDPPRKQNWKNVLPHAYRIALRGVLPCDARSRCGAPAVPVRGGLSFAGLHRIGPRCGRGGGPGITAERRPTIVTAADRVGGAVSAPRPPGP